MDWPYLILLAASISFMLLQAITPNKQTKHYLLAFFCVSMAMTSLQHLSAPSIGPYQYLIGFGTCASCNVVWLIARALFRTERAIEAKHLAIAGMIALLIILNNSHALLNGLNIQNNPLSMFNGSINEVLNLLSSTILMLSLFEALRHFNSKSKEQKWQSGIFAGAFVTGLVSCMVLPTFFEPELRNTIRPYLVSFSAILIMLCIHIVIRMQARPQNHVLKQAPAEPENTTVRATKSVDSHLVEAGVIKAIDSLIHKQQIYLQSNVKIATVAHALNMPEYKVSRAIRYHYDSPNFNAFINHFRIEHAKNLIASKEAKQWSMLVVSLESGFASVVTFNRTFKAMVGYLPSEYKKLNQH